MKEINDALHSAVIAQTWTNHKTRDLTNASNNALTNNCEITKKYIYAYSKCSSYMIDRLEEKRDRQTHMIVTLPFGWLFHFLNIFV